MAIRVLLADDHKNFRSEIRQILSGQRDIEVVGEADSGMQAVEMARQLRPDVAVLDVRMEPLSGISAIPALLHGSPDTAILMLSIHDDKRYVSLSLKLGAKGYLLKDSAEDTLVDAIHSVHLGTAFFDPAVLRFVLDQ